MITTVNANNILKLYFGQVKSITGSGKCYLGLSTTTPTADGSNFTEPNSANTGYQRVQININEAEEYTNKMTVPSAGAIENKAEITFPEAQPNGYTVTHYGIFSAETGGIPLYTHALTAATPNEYGEYPAQPVTVEPEEVLLFKQGALSLAFVFDEE